MISVSKRPNSRKKGPLGLNIKSSRKNSVPITVSDLGSDSDDKNTFKEA